jgi:hypothetical protein
MGERMVLPALNKDLEDGTPGPESWGDKGALQGVR